MSDRVGHENPGPAMRILVTGGAGYIGSHTLVRLLEAGHSVHVIDDLSNGHTEALERVRDITGRDFGFSQMDIRDGNRLSGVIDAYQPDAVIHFAALKSPFESISAPDRYFDVNVNGCRRLLDALTGSRCRRVVFSSSAAVYGAPEYLPVDELHPVKPTTPYGESKLAAEQLMQETARKEPAWSFAILRYFNPVGAHPSGLIGEQPSFPPSNLVPHIAEVAAGRRPSVSIFGEDFDTPDGTGIRDYIHVDDLAKAHLAALRWTGQSAKARVFNLGVGQGTSVSRMVQAFEEVSAREIPVLMSERREGDVAVCFADPSRAETELNWRAESSVRQMCASCWSWIEKNPNGYRDNRTDVALGGKLPRV